MDSSLRSAPENDRRVYHHDFADAGEARDHDDHQNGAGGPGSYLPRQLETAQIDRDARGDFKEAGAKADADRIADTGDHDGLEQHHPQDRAVRNAHRFERAKLAQILDHEDVEGLADNRGADDKAERDGDPEIYRDTGSLKVVANRREREVAPSERFQSGLGRDALREDVRVHLRPRVDQHEGHLLARADD